MKKLLLFAVAVMLTMVVSVGQAASVAVTSDTELVLLPDNGIRGACVSAKLAWDGQKWRRQVGSYKADFTIPANHPAWEHARTLAPPQRVGTEKWEPYGWALYDCNGNVIAGGKAATTTTTVTQTVETKPLPAISQPAVADPNLKAELAALKARLAAAEAAEAKRLANAAKPAAAARPAPAKRVAKAKPAAKSIVCVSQSDFDKLKEQVDGLDKTLNGKEEGGSNLVDKVNHYWETGTIQYDSNGKLFEKDQKVLNDWFYPKNSLTKADLKGYATTADLAKIANQPPNGWITMVAIFLLLLAVAAIIISIAAYRRNRP